MNICFRVDSSSSIGTGHVMRCLVLAGLLRERGVKVLFACREDGLFDCIENNGFKVLSIPNHNQLHEEQTSFNAGRKGDDRSIIDAFEVRRALEVIGENIDWMVVDHYGLSVEWERIARSFVKRLLVIDDYIDRAHDCDALLNQDDMFEETRRYIQNDCKLFLGPRYLLLRREFLLARKNMMRSYGAIKRIMVFFGGCDSTNETLKVLEALLMFERSGVAVDAVVGRYNPFKDEIAMMVAGAPHIHIHGEVNNMANAILEADLAVGAGGMANWERCYMGLPSIVTIVADNQKDIIMRLENIGAVINMGHTRDTTVADYYTTIQMMMTNPDRCKEMSCAAISLLKDNAVDSICGYMCNQK